MKILLVEDDDNKMEQISEFVSRSFASDELIVRRSFQSGLKEIALNTPDVVLLDMTMPNYDVSPREAGGRERRYAGKEILRQIKRRGIVVPVVVVTQYEQFEEDGQLVTLAELVSTLHSQFSECFLGAVFYQAGNTEWMVRLADFLGNVKAGHDKS